jgi:hypothetical protein
MTQNESVADIFLMALKSMPKELKETVLVKLVHDKEFFQDLQDLMVFEERKNDARRPFHEFLAEHQR